jgi:hypothetical protein
MHRKGVHQFVREQGAGDGVVMQIGQPVQPGNAGRAEPGSQMLPLRRDHGRAAFDQDVAETGCQRGVVCVAGRQKVACQQALARSHLDEGQGIGPAQLFVELGDLLCQRSGEKGMGVETGVVIAGPSNPILANAIWADTIVASPFFSVRVGCARVVAEVRMVEREFHKALESDRPGRPDLGHDCRDSTGVADWRAISLLRAVGHSAFGL